MGVECEALVVRTWSIFQYFVLWCYVNWIAAGKQSVTVADN